MAGHHHQRCLLRSGPWSLSLLWSRVAPLILLSQRQSWNGAVVRRTGQWPRQRSRTKMDFGRKTDLKMPRTGGYRRSAVWRPCGVTPHAALQNKSVVCSGSRVTISTVMKLHWSVKRGGINVETYTKSTCSHYHNSNQNKTWCNKYGIWVWPFSHWAELSGRTDKALIPTSRSQTIPNQTKPNHTKPNHTKPYQTIPNKRSKITSEPVIDPGYKSQAFSVYSRT